MGKLARSRKVPDELANLYEFANSLDCRRSTRGGGQSSCRDELADPHALAAWMSERGLITPGAQITRSMFRTAIQLRASIRAFIACGPAERRTNRRVLRSLDAIIQRFPLVAEVGRTGEMRLRPARSDALSGLATIVAELQRGWANGALDRLKMCTDEECAWVFFDRSKPGSRRWCSSTGCGNRAKTRRYRERHRAAG
jgi:predicted RNA-binding Zn ribbon-like protein